MAVSFDEQWGSPTISFRDGKLIGKRVFVIDWSDQLAFVEELFGTYKNVGGSFVYTPPAHFPNAPTMYPVSIDVKPFGDRIVSAATALSTGSDYEKAQVDVAYELQFDGDESGQPDGTFLRYSSDIGAEYLTIPGRVWRWPGGEVLGEDPNLGIIVPTEQFTLSWERVPAPPWTAIYQLRGRINASAWRGYPAGTVMFMGARAEIAFQVLQGSYWNLEYHFSVKTQKLTNSSGWVGWNHFYKKEPESSEHWLAIVDESGNNPYQAGDFTNLFAFE